MVVEHIQLMQPTWNQLSIAESLTTLGLGNGMHQVLGIGTGLAALSLPQRLSLPVVAYIIKLFLPFVMNELFHFSTYLLP